MTKCLDAFPNTPRVSRVYSLKTLGKEQFLLFPQCFVLVWKTFCHVHPIQNCCLQNLSVWNGLQLVVWEKGYKSEYLPGAMNKCRRCQPRCSDHEESRPYERNQSEVETRQYNVAEANIYLDDKETSGNL